MKTLKHKKPSIFTQFLWWTAGADQPILLRSTHSDRVKYLTLGGIILATGIMAGLAGGYAFYTIFSPKGDALQAYVEVADAVNLGVQEQMHWPTVVFSVFFGILWGLMIFNIDRFIVTSTGTGDGTEKITWGEFKSAIPRLIMGAIIAITISKPVEIRMFKSEIDAELHIAQQEQAAKYEEKTRAAFKPQFDRVESDIAEIKYKETALEEQLKNAEKEMMDQLQGRAGHAAGFGPRAKKLEQIKKEWEGKLMDYRRSVAPELLELDSTRKQLIAELNEQLQYNTKVASGMDGLLERIKLAHDIAGTSITLFITLLFLAIELTPIFFKLMLIKSPYDYLVENQKELVKARDGIHIEYNYYPPEDDDGNIREGTERHLIRFLEKDQMNLEQLGLQQVQKELTEYAIQKFKEEQMKLIDENPSNFINVTTNNTE